MATITDAASLIPAASSTAVRLAVPWMPASPERVASSIASAWESMTTIFPRSVPRAIMVSTAARPFVPNPMTMVWSFKPLLQIRSRKAVRVRSASTSMVVPTRMIRNRIRAGVISTVVTSRASSVTGVMSP